MDVVVVFEEVVLVPHQEETDLGLGVAGLDPVALEQVSSVVVAVGLDWVVQVPIQAGKVESVGFVDLAVAL